MGRKIGPNLMQDTLSTIIILLATVIIVILYGILYSRWVADDLESCITDEKNLFGIVEGSQEYVYFCSYAGIVIVDKEHQENLEEFAK